MIIYQILPRLFGNQNATNKPHGTLQENGCGKFSSIDEATLDYLKWLGVSHLYLTGLLPHITLEDFPGQAASHPSLAKGRAGSPFAIRNHYDVAAYLADDPDHRMEEFKAMLDRIHGAGLKLIMDFVPNHVARDYESAPYTGPEGMQLGATDDPSVHWKHDNDFFYYPSQYLSMPQADSSDPYIEYPAKASGNVFGPTVGVNDWYETIKLNYCDSYSPTWEKMYSVLNFWAAKGVDGFRCDMVELVPPEFFKWAIYRLKQAYPQIVFIGEVYKKEQYKQYIREVGFDLLYDKSGLYDTLKTMMSVKRESDRQMWQSAGMITGVWQFLGDIQPYMLNFLENHDEVRFASDFYAGSATRTAAPLAVSLFLNRASFMLYAGEEIGERGMDAEGFSEVDGRTTIFDWWNPVGLQELWKIIHTKSYLEGPSPLLELYHVFLQEKGLKLNSEGLTYDLCYCNQFPGSVFAFIRSYGEVNRLYICNLGSESQKVQVLVPQHAFNYLPIRQNDVLQVGTPLHAEVGPYCVETIDL